VLGLAWFAKDNNRFAAANESGQIAVFSVDDAMSCRSTDDSSVDSDSDSNKSRPTPIVKYNNLDRVTSVCILFQAFLFHFFFFVLRDIILDFYCDDASTSSNSCEL